MRELNKSEIQEVSGGDGIIDDLFGDGILGGFIQVGIDFYNEYLSDWFEGLFGGGS